VGIKRGAGDKDQGSLKSKSSLKDSRYKSEISGRVFRVQFEKRHQNERGGLNILFASQQVVVQKKATSGKEREGKS